MGLMESGLNQDINMNLTCNLTKTKHKIPSQVPSWARRRDAHVLGQATLVGRLHVASRHVSQLDGYRVFRVLREAEAVLDKELLWRGIQTSKPR